MIISTKECTGILKICFDGTSEIEAIDLQSPSCTAVHDITFCQSGESSGIFIGDDSGIGIIVLENTTFCITDDTACCAGCRDRAVLTKRVINIY